MTTRITVDVPSYQISGVSIIKEQDDPSGQDGRDFVKEYIVKAGESLILHIYGNQSLYIIER